MASTVLGVIRTSDLQITKSGPSSLYARGVKLADAVRKFFKRYTNGTTAGKRDVAYEAQYTISGSSTQNIDLTGTLTDPYGVTVSFAKVCEIRVLNFSDRRVDVGPVTATPFGVATFWGADNDLTGVGAAGSTDEPGELFISHPAGVAPGAGTDLIRLVNPAAGTALVTLQVVGKSA